MNKNNSIFVNNKQNIMNKQDKVNQIEYIKNNLHFNLKKHGRTNI